MVTPVKYESDWNNLTYIFKNQINERGFSYHHPGPSGWKRGLSEISSIWAELIIYTPFRRRRRANEWGAWWTCLFASNTFKCPFSNIVRSETGFCHFSVCGNASIDICIAIRLNTYIVALIYHYTTVCLTACSNNIKTQKPPWLESPRHDSPHKGPAMWKVCPCHDAIMSFLKINYKRDHGNRLCHQSTFPKGSLQHPMKCTQRAHGVIMTPLLRQNDVTTSFWRNDNVIITSCVRWVRTIGVKSCQACNLILELGCIQVMTENKTDPVPGCWWVRCSRQKRPFHKKDLRHRGTMKGSREIIRGMVTAETFSASQHNQSKCQRG